MVQLQSFNAEYVRRLHSGDAGIENHFALYFGHWLSVKLRMRPDIRPMLDDIRQETLLRVLEIVRRKRGIAHPERFGAFVNAVCNNVLMEHRRAAARHDPLNPHSPEPPDRRINLDAHLINSETRREVLLVMRELPPKDRRLLEAVYLQEMDKSEVCRRYGVDGNYLRVLLHRAKARFRKVYQEQEEARLMAGAA